MQCPARLFCSLSLCCLFTANQVNADTVASTLGPAIADDVNVTSFGYVDLPGDLGDLVDPSARTIIFSSGGDGFGYFSRLNSAPFTLLDDSLDNFTAAQSGSTPPLGDILGIIKDADNDDFFGVVDTVNGDNDSDPNTTGAQSVPLTAEWVFDITGAAPGLGISIDMAAMGDFESSGEAFDFEVSFDGTNFTNIFSVTINEDVEADYTLEGVIFAEETTEEMDDGMGGTIPAGFFVGQNAGDPRIVTLSDPAFIGDVQLDNEFQTFTANLADPGGSTSLTLRFTADSNGGSEGFAFRNVIIEDGVMATNPVGDYDDNGVVDARDYAVWREALGTMTVLPNDPVGGTIGTDQYTNWRSNFGDSGSAGGSIQSTPEPSSLLLFALGLLAAPAMRRRK